MTDEKITIEFTPNQLLGIFYFTDMGYCKLAASLSKDRLEKSQLENQYLIDFHGVRDLNLDEVFEKTSEIQEILLKRYEEFEKSKETEVSE